MCTALTLPVVSHAAIKSIQRINSTQLYPLWFPGELKYIQISGTTDRRTYSSEKITYGLDYVVLKYDYPRFNYVDSTTLVSGCYLVQFVDNFNGLSATMTFNNVTDSTMEKPSASKPYVLVGNTSSYKSITPSGKFLKYSTTQYKFLATSGETVAGYEAYIISNASNPVPQIVIGNPTSGIQRVFAADGTRLSVTSTEGGVTIFAAARTMINIYSVSGQTVKTVQLSEGRTFTALPKGLYIAGNTKFTVK